MRAGAVALRGCMLARPGAILAEIYTTFTSTEDLLDWAYRHMLQERDIHKCRGLQLSKLAQEEVVGLEREMHGCH